MGDFYLGERPVDHALHAKDDGRIALLSSGGRRKLAFVFSGGGPLGCIQVGAAEALLEAGIRPDLIVGTSVGALNGGWLALYPTLDGVRQLKEIWASMTSGSVFTGGRRRAFLRFLLGRDHLYTDKGLRDLITRLKGNIDFQDLTVPLYVTATDMDTGGLQVFHEGRVEPAVMASTAIPGVFPLVSIDGHTYGDGGIFSNCSIQTACDAGATHTVVIHCPHPPPKEWYGILGPLAKSLWVSLGRLCGLEVERFRGFCPSLVLAPEVDLPRDHNFSFASTVELMDQAKAWSANYLREHANWLTESQGTTSHNFGGIVDKEALA